MDGFREYMLDKIAKLHIKINYGRSYEGSLEADYERVADRVKYETLSEVVRANKDWDTEEFSRDLSEIIRNRTSLYR